MEESDLRKSIFGISPSENISFKPICEGSEIYEVSCARRTTEELFKLFEDFVEESPDKELQPVPKMPKRSFSTFLPGFSKKKATADNVADSGVFENVENLSLGNSQVQNLASEDVEVIRAPLQLPKASLYFDVLFCKQSARKHKKWEGDGILSINGTSAILKNMEGKEVACGSGYKMKEVIALEEGSQFLIGGKECEIQSSVSEEDYASGKCFTEM